MKFKKNFSIKLIAYLSLFFAVIFISLLFFLYQFPYDKFINDFFAQYDYRIQTEKIYYKPLSTLLIKNLSIPAKDINSPPVLNSDQIRVDFLLIPLLNKILQANFSVDAYNGSITGNIIYNLSDGKLKNIFMEFNNINIINYPYFNISSPFNIDGILSGKILLSDLEQGYTGEGEFFLAGPITLLNIKYKEFNLPDMEFDEGNLKFTVNGNLVSINNLILNGKFVQISGKGAIELGADTDINLSLSITPVNISQEIKNLVVLLSGMNNIEKGINLKIHGALDELEYNIIPLRHK